MIKTNPTAVKQVITEEEKKPEPSNYQSKTGTISKVSSIEHKSSKFTSENNHLEKSTKNQLSQKTDLTTEVRDKVTIQKTTPIPV